MADHHKQTDHADVFRDEAESEVEEREAASRSEGDELKASSDPNSEEDSQDARDEDSEWGFDQDDSGMATETKIGLALIVVLLATFGFVVYRKLDEKRQLAAMAESKTQTADDERQAKATSPVSPPPTEPTQAPGSDESWQPFAEAQSEPEPIESRSAAALQQTAARPVQDDPFANARPSAGPSPAVAGPVTESDNPFADTAQSQTAARPSSDEVEDLFPDVATRPSATTSRAGSATVVQDLEDPFFEPVSDTRPAAAGAHDGRPMPDPSVTPAAAITTTGGPTGGQAGTADAGTEQPPAQAADTPFDPFAPETPEASVSATSPSTGPLDSGEATAIEEPADLFEPVEVTGTRQPPAQPRPLEELPAERQAAPTQPAPVDIGFSPIEDAPAGNRVTGETATPAGTNPFDAREGRNTGSFPAESAFSPTDSASSVGVYEVQHGDNYWKISRKVYGTPIYFTALARANRERIPDPTRMRPGMKVLAPPAGLLRAQNPDLFSPQTASRQTDSSNRKPKAPAGFFMGPQGQPHYRVGSSDTLSTISQKHLGRSSRWIEIYELNRKTLKNPNDLQIGDELLLPRDASRVSLAPPRSLNR